MMNRRTMLKTGVAAAIWSTCSSALAAAETGTAIPSDWMIVDGTNNVAFNADTIADLKRAGVCGLNYNQVGLTSDALRYETITLEAIDSFPNDLVLARTVADFHVAKKPGKIATVIGWQSADPVAGEPGYNNPWMTNPPHSELRAHYELGLRICGISFNTPNLFGGGCLAPRTPLSRYGRLLIEQLHKLRILVDTCHAGEQTALDAAAISNGVPVICSHTGVASLNDNPRNISDRVIDAIANTGGVIGVFALNDGFARSRKDAAIVTTPIVGVDAMATQCDYIRTRVGIDHVGLGTDFSQGDDMYVDPSHSELTPPEMASKQGPLNYVRGFSRITDLPNLVAALKRKGWPDADVRKFLGENWLRVYGQAWGA